MLSKILQINRNFISAGIIILFASGMLAYADILGNDYHHAISWFSILLSSIIAISSVNSMVYFRNQYFAFFYMLLVFAFFSGDNLLEFYAAFLFLIVIQTQMFLNISNGKAILNSFDLGFFSGFFILFYTPYIIFLAPLWIYYLILGKIEVRKFLLHLLGIFTFAFLGLELLATFDIWYVWDDVVSLLDFNLVQFNSQQLFLLPIVGFVIIAFIDYVQNLNRHSNDKKLIYFTASFYLISTIVYLILWGGGNVDHYLLFTFPLALFLTNYFTYNKKNLIQKEIYLWILVVSVILYKISPYLSLPSFFDNVTF
ncbi:MAG: DUF6427 family protein [Weeksellaceae bacterium]